MSNYNLLNSQQVIYFHYDNLLLQQEMKRYTSYKMRTEESYISEDHALEMETLSILEQLGYPMNHIGTYLYKNMIIKVANHLELIIDKNDYEDECKKLISQIETPFSQFYVDVARNDLDIGVKSFHQNVTKAVENVNYSVADPNLLINFNNSVFGKNDYKKQSFVIGAYVLEHLKQKEKAVSFIKSLPVVSMNNN